MKLLKLNIQLFGTGVSATASTTVTSPAGNKATLTAYFEENSINVQNNQSNITCTASFKMTSGSFAQYSTPKLEIYWHDNYTNSDILVSSLGVTSCNSGETKTTSGTKDITHKADGTLSGYAIAKWVYDGGGAYAPASGSVSTANTALSTIPRATPTPSINAYVGEGYAIILNPASTSFRHTIRYSIGTITDQLIATNVSDNCIWNVPTSLYQQIGPNNRLLSGLITVETYSGSTFIGTTSNTFTALTKESLAKPNVSITSIVDQNSTTTALTGNSSKIVLNASNVRVTFNTTSSSSATISQANIKVNGVTATSYNTSTGVGYCDINKPSSSTFTVTVTDSRSYVNSSQQTPTYVNYIPLSISNASVARTVAVTENKATLSVNGNYTSVNFGSQSNALTLQYKIGSGSWTSLTPTITDNTYSKTQTLTNLLYTSSYTIYVKVTDKVNTSGITSTLTLKRGVPVWWADGENFYVEVNFVNRSQESRKKNFEDFDLNAIDVIKKGKIYKFNYDVEQDGMGKHYGFVIPDKGGKFITPKEVLNEKGDSVEYYAMMSILWEAMKQMINKNEELEKEIKALKESDK